MSHSRFKFEFKPKANVELINNQQQEALIKDNSGIQKELEIVRSKIDNLSLRVQDANNEEVQASITNFDRLMSEVLKEGVQRHEEFLLNDIAVMRTAKVETKPL